MDDKPTISGMKLPASLLAVVLFTASPRAMAQAVSGECASADMADATKAVEPFVEAMLTPGKSMSLPDLIKTVGSDVLIKMGEFQKAEAERRVKDWANLCR
jgi:hypothetical protein